MAKDANGENVTCLEISEVVLVHCNFCQQPLSTRFKSLYTFFSNKSFDQLLDIPPKSFIF